MEDRTVKRILGQQLNDNSDSDSIKTSQIFDNGQSKQSIITGKQYIIKQLSQAVVLEDLNMRYQIALSARRKATTETEMKKQTLVIQKLLGHFHQAVVKIVKKTVDSLHCSRKAIEQGVIYEDALLKIQFITDYQNGN